MRTLSIRYHRPVVVFRILVYAIMLSTLRAQSVPKIEACLPLNSSIDLTHSRPGRKCLSALSDPQYVSYFDVCKTNVCFIFKYETPMVEFNSSLTVETADLKYRLPFKCGEPAEWHPSLTGIAMEILSKTSAREEYCVWAGAPNECTWNGLVAFTDLMAYRGYQFTIIGPMLETPERMCSHFTSTPYLDNPMVVIGKNTPSKAGVGEQIKQITSPFTAGSWVVLAVIVLLFITVSVIIVCTFHGSSPHTLITMYLVLVGDLDRAMEYTRPSTVPQEQNVRSSRESFTSASSSEASVRESIHLRRISESRLARHRPSYFCTTSLCRYAFISFLALFFLFYEAAVVQSLFQHEKVTIPKSVESLSENELRHFAVMKDSALEDIWASTVDPSFTEDWANKSKVPWRRCQNTRECVDWLISESHDVNFIVTYELEGSFLVHQLSDCKELTITETMESLHHFNSGWLYNREVDETKRRKFDRELVLLRIKGTIKKFSEELEDGKCKPQTRFDIGPFILLIPVLVLVFPPLVLSVLVLYC